jgi:hypothetical protein
MLVKLVNAIRNIPYIATAVLRSVSLRFCYTGLKYEAEISHQLHQPDVILKSADVCSHTLLSTSKL